MFVTLASVAAGVTVSTVRWLVIDTIHHWTGLPQPAWDFSRFQDRVGAYNVLNDIHYKFYQSHANGLGAPLSAGGEDHYCGVAPALARHSPRDHIGVMLL